MINYAVVLGVSLVIFLITLYVCFPPRSWPTFLFLISLLGTGISAVVISTEKQRKLPKLQFKKLYRYYGVSKDGNLFLSALMETQSTVSDGKGPDLVISRQWEKDAIYQAKANDLHGERRVVMSESLKPGEICALGRNGGHLDGQPCLMLYEAQLVEE